MAEAAAHTGRFSVVFGASRSSSSRCLNSSFTAFMFLKGSFFMTNQLVSRLIVVRHLIPGLYARFWANAV